MARHTSLYLNDELDAAVKAARLPLPEIIRRGLACTGHDNAAMDELRIRVQLLEQRLDGHQAAHPAPCRHQAAERDLTEYLTHLAAGLAAAFPQPFTIDAAAGHWHTAGRTARTRIQQMLAAGLLEQLPPAHRPGAGSRAGRAPSMYRICGTPDQGKR